MRRIADQVLVLLAIKDVREELKRAGDKRTGYEILMRLSTLYAVLNVDTLIEVTKDADKRDNKREAA